MALSDALDVALSDAGAPKRLQTELLVWGISISLDEFSQFGFSVDRVKVFGVQWHPEQFLNKACEVDHPLDPAAALPEVLSEAISFHARQGLHAVAKRRVEFFHALECKSCGTARN